MSCRIVEFGCTGRRSLAAFCVVANRADAPTGPGGRRDRGRLQRTAAEQDGSPGRLLPGQFVAQQRDWQQHNAAEAALLLSSDVGPLRFVANVRAAHYFHGNRDSLDVFATAGAAVRVTPWLQSGVEYLGEELEGVTRWDLDVGPGGRHFVGPSTTVLIP